MSGHDDGQAPERVRELAEPLAEALDLEVLEVAISGPGGRPLIRVTVDASPSDTIGVDVDDVAALSRRLGEVLDEQDVMPGAYTLEVTSPGADRPLRAQRDFARNIGREVRVLGREGSDAPAEVTGTLVAVDEDRVTLDVEGSQVQLDLADLESGRVVLPW